MKQTKKHLTNQDLIDMLNNEIEKNGSGVWSDRRKALEEMLRMRGVNTTKAISHESEKIG